MHGRRHGWKELDRDPSATAINKGFDVSLLKIGPQCVRVAYESTWRRDSLVEKYINPTLP